MTVRQLAWMLVHIAFAALRGEYKAPYLQACNGSIPGAALMWVRRPLRLGSSEKQSRNACAHVCSNRVRSGGYPSVYLGTDVQGRPVNMRLHYMLTYLLHGPPRVPDQCATHEDHIHRAGHTATNQGLAVALSPPCRSLLCVNPDHLTGWSYRADNSRSGRDRQVVKSKRLRHRPA